MRWKRAAMVILPTVWSFIPLFVVEQAADYYYLADNPAVFFTISGWRLPLFIIIAVAGSVAAGALLRDIRASAVSELIGFFFAFLTFYWLCDPRVCFSTGIDGLEPLRMGFFLGSVVVAGTALGMSVREVSPPRRSHLIISYCAFAAVAFYPVVFTFAGTRILWSFHPWAAIAALGVAAFAVSAGVSNRVGKIEGLVIPPVALLSLLLLASGMAAAYAGSLIPVAALMVFTTMLGSACGVALAAFRRGSTFPSKTVSTVYALALAFVLATMIVAVPDAVSAVEPQAFGSQVGLTLGVPVYVGAYMDAPAGHSLGAGVTVDFSNSNSSVIQADNFLSAGIGIHAAGCCVDGIDYSYRFDAYLFHDGNESLAASAWEICDDNAACGGHSWKSLMFAHTAQLDPSAAGENISLRVAWVAASPGMVEWNYSIANGRQVHFTTFVAPRAENRDFNTGLLEGGTIGPQQSGSYFFQFGIMSAYPIDHPGWRVELTCPQVLASVWGCVEHARTLQGDQAFWKVYWRWGEDYPNVSVSTDGFRSIIFEHAVNSSQSFQNLW